MVAKLFSLAYPFTAYFRQLYLSHWGGGEGELFTLWSSDHFLIAFGSMHECTTPAKELKYVRRFSPYKWSLLGKEQVAQALELAVEKEWAPPWSKS